MFTRGVTTCVVACLLLMLTAPALAVNPITPTPFTPNNPLGGGPIGWTFAGNKFVGTVLGDGTGRMYSTDLSGNNVQPFGGTVNLLNGHGQEHYVAASFGLGGFAAGDIWVASDNNIQHITNAGVPDPGLFINGSTGGIVGLVRGIMFDTVGTFGNQMIIDTDQGNIYTVNSSGIPTLIQSTGVDTEGLDIAPLNGTWGSKAGWLFVASEGTNTISAIKPGSFAMVTVATNVASAEQIEFVPMSLGTNPLEGLYSADWGVNILHTPASQFAGMEGDLIVTSELYPHAVIDLTPGLQQNLIANYPNQPEDGIFVTSDMLALDGTVPEPSTLALLGLAVPALLARRSKRSQGRV